jgi:hypothetical protein
MATVVTRVLGGVPAPPEAAARERRWHQPAIRLPFFVDRGRRALYFPGDVSIRQPRAFTRAEGGMTMLDVLYIGLALGFLALSWGLVELCDRL